MINDAAIALIKYYEGILDGKPDTPGYDPYLDPIDIPTIGWGSIWGFDGKPITMDHRAITMDEAQFLLDREIADNEKYVDRLIVVRAALGLVRDEGEASVVEPGDALDLAVECGAVCAARGVCAVRVVRPGAVRKLVHLSGTFDLPASRAF